MLLNRCRITACLFLLFCISQNTNAQIELSRITPDNAEKLVMGGPDAIGGIGDWFISNGTLCAVISDIGHESEFTTRGGTLIDLGFCNRDDDHYTHKHTLLDGSRAKPLNATDLTVSKGDSWAAIEVTAERDNIQTVTRYHVQLDQPKTLSIETTVSLLDANKDGLNFFNLLHFNYHSLNAFIFNSEDISQSSGFASEHFSSKGISAIRDAAKNADTIITLSPHDADVAISYGWQLKKAKLISGEQSMDLPRFALADDTTNGFLVLPEHFMIGSGKKIGWVQLAQIPLLSLENKAQLKLHESIVIEKSGDVASITDQLLAKTDTQRVIVNTQNLDSSFHVEQTDGTPITQALPDKNGQASFLLPEGRYTLHQIASGERQAQMDFDVDSINANKLSSSNELSLGYLNLTSGGKLTLPQGQAMRLVFKGINGTPDPDFGLAHQQSPINDRHTKTMSHIFMAGISSDQQSLFLAAGDYKVLATRGPEFSLESSEIRIENGKTTRLDITTPSRVVETSKYMASDLHVHSGVSFDNAFSTTERVRTFIAEHAEIMVSSEHDLPFDFAPIVQAMNLSDKIITIPAAEITSTALSKANPYTGGHVNAFPFLPRPHEHRNGMFNHEEFRLRDTIAAVKHQHPEALLQLNHPRTTSKLSSKLPSDYEEHIHYGSYFEHMGPAAHPYQPERPLTESPNSQLIEKDPKTGIRDVDFDLLEVVNPGGENHQDRINAVRKDWLSLVKQGEKITATANSDSHTPHEVVGVPRTMVAMQNDTIAGYSQAEFLNSLATGNAYGTTGPFFDIELGGAKMGETFNGNRGDLSLRVYAADWVPLDTVSVQINGESIGEYPLKNGEQTILRLPLTFHRDSFVTIEIHGKASENYALLYPEIEPYAFSNPIFVDFEGDNTWTPPGLSSTDH